MSRQENFEPLCQLYRREGAATWTILLKQEEDLKLKEPIPMGAFEWLKIFKYTIRSWAPPALPLIYCHIIHTKFEENDRYIFLCDDDWIEPGFFEKLDNITEPMIIVGMLRGQHTPTDPGHPTWPLIPSPSSLHYGFTGFEQGIFTGKILRDMRQEAAGWVLRSVPNEMMLFKAAERYPTAYVPGVNVWFNYLEPGRWDK